MSGAAWPTHSHENWRRSAFLRPPAGIGEGADAAGGEWSTVGALAPQAAIDNGHLVAAAPPADVSLRPLEKGEEAWGLTPAPNSAAWREWARRTSHGHLLEIAPGASPGLIVIRERVAPQGQAVGHHLAVRAGGGAKAKVLLMQEGPEGAGGFYTGGLLLEVAADADLEAAVVQDLPLSTDAYCQMEAVAAQGARATLRAAAVGGARTRTEVRLAMAGAGAEAFLRGVYLASGDQRMEFHTHQDHLVGETESDLLLKGAAMGAARVLYQGMINVRPKAQKSNAYQTNRNLVISPAARVDTIPGLEIEANDVRCSHGATVSRLSPEALFYLESRGIGPADAARLLAEGFFYEIADEFPEGAREWVRARARRELAAAL